MFAGTKAAARAIEEFRLALLEFKRTYNEHWMLERYDYRSPAQVRRDLVGLDGVEANTVKPLSKNPGAIHSQWRDQFLAAGQASLKSRAPDARDEANRRLQAKIGELLMENELLYAKVDQLEAAGPLARRRSRR